MIQNQPKMTRRTAKDVRDELDRLVLAALKLYAQELHTQHDRPLGIGVRASNVVNHVRHYLASQEGANVAQYASTWSGWWAWCAERDISVAKVEDHVQRAAERLVKRGELERYVERGVARYRYVLEEERLAEEQKKQSRERARVGREALLATLKRLGVDSFVNDYDELIVVDCAKLNSRLLVGELDASEVRS